MSETRDGGTGAAVSDTPVVYVVDDDDLMRAALKRVFLAARMEVAAFSSAHDLLETCDFRRLGVLLLDVLMPGMNGLELQIALHERGVKLPVIFLTGSADVPMAVSAMREGAVDFLEKPFDNGQLVLRVQRAFAQSRTPAPSGARPDPEYERRRSTLTPREREVMDEIITGKTNKVIARNLDASYRTIEIHRARVMSKMVARSLADLVRMSLEAELRR